MHDDAVRVDEDGTDELLDEEKDKADVDAKVAAFDGTDNAHPVKCPHPTQHEPTASSSGGVDCCIRRRDDSDEGDDAKVSARPADTAVADAGPEYSNHGGNTRDAHQVGRPSLIQHEPTASSPGGVDCCVHLRDDNLSHIAADNEGSFHEACASLDAYMNAQAQAQQAFDAVAIHVLGYVRQRLRAYTTDDPKAMTEEYNQLLILVAPFLREQCIVDPEIVEDLRDVAASIKTSQRKLIDLPPAESIVTFDTDDDWPPRDHDDAHARAHEVDNPVDPFLQEYCPVDPELVEDIRVVAASIRARRSDLRSTLEQGIAEHVATDDDAAALVAPPMGLIVVSSGCDTAVAWATFDADGLCNDDHQLRDADPPKAVPVDNEQVIMILPATRYTHPDSGRAVADDSGRFPSSSEWPDMIVTRALNDPPLGLIVMSSATTLSFPREPPDGSSTAEENVRPRFERCDAAHVDESTDTPPSTSSSISEALQLPADSVAHTIFNVMSITSVCQQACC